MLGLCLGPADGKLCPCFGATPALPTWGLEETERGRGSNTHISIFGGGVQSELPKFLTTPMARSRKINRAGTEIRARNFIFSPFFKCTQSSSPLLSLPFPFFFSSSSLWTKDSTIRDANTKQGGYVLKMPHGQ